VHRLTFCQGMRYDAFIAYGPQQHAVTWMWACTRGHRPSCLHQSLPSIVFFISYRKHLRIGTV
jgi:hypothetical protein